MISLGTVLRYAGHWWTVSMVGITGGERYYWLTGNNEVVMIPAFIIEIPVIETIQAIPTTHTESDKGMSMKRRTLISEMDKPPVFDTCNVCGRKLHYKDEADMGMCEGCADE